MKKYEFVGYVSKETLANIKNNKNIVREGSYYIAKLAFLLNKKSGSIWYDRAKDMTFVYTTAQVRGRWFYGYKDYFAYGKVVLSGIN